MWWYYSSLLIYLKTKKIKTMNDDINDILNVSDSTTNDIIDNEQGIQDEKNLKKIAGIILIIGIILSLILLFSIAIVTVDGGY